MDFDEVKRRLTSVLYTMDKLLRDESVVAKGVEAVQEMAGCFALLGEICRVDQLQQPEPIHEGRPETGSKQ